MKLPTLECNRCGWKWHPRSEKLPDVCPNPKCKSRYWNRPRKMVVKVKPSSEAETESRK